MAIARPVSDVRRIGLIVLSTDLTVEGDVVRMSPGDEVVFHATRVPFHNPVTVESLHALRQELVDAAKLLLPDVRLDAIAFACTAASALLGQDTIQSLLQQVKPGTPVTTPMRATIEGFVALGIKKPSILAPYPYAVSRAMADHFEQHGYPIVSLTHLGIEDDREIARIESDRLVAAAIETARNECDGLFIPCTATPALRLIEAIEQTVHKPVICSNQAMIWHSLRLAGYTQPIAGFGQLATQAVSRS